MKKLKLIFMGTPDFALPSLDLLQISPHAIAGLVTQPDRPRGRGRQLYRSPTKKWALKHGVELFQPEKMNDEDFLTWLSRINPDLIVTVAYGRLLSKKILDLPPLGCINLHASYLPAYRGAAPIHRAVIDGAEYSGVSIIDLTRELDGGDVIMQEKEEISFYDTAGMLHDRLAARGASLLVKAINALADGTAQKTPQDPALVTYAPPLDQSDEKLNWNNSALEIYNRIRGLNPWPGAYTSLRGKRLKVWQAALPDLAENEEAGTEPGTILAVSEGSLIVSTGTNNLTLLNLQPAGKKAMDAGAFCCGYRIEPGERLDGE
ncbi:MAG: methionyl-tRNA formyltransferase [Dethiobacteria bacterium]